MMLPRTLTHVAQDLLGGEDHVILKIGSLSNVSVDLDHNAPRLDTFVEGRAKENWPYGTKFVKCFRIEELTCGVFGELKQATGQIITERVSQDEIFCFTWRDITAFFRSNEHELSLDESDSVRVVMTAVEQSKRDYLVVQQAFGTEFIHWNVFVRMRKRCCWFSPQWWVLGNVELLPNRHVSNHSFLLALESITYRSFFSMTSIIEPYAIYRQSITRKRCKQLLDNSIPAGSQHSGSAYPSNSNDLTPDSFLNALVRCERG